MAPGKIPENKRVVPDDLIYVALPDGRLKANMTFRERIDQLAARAKRGGS
jgi:hypothetical protein